jgi:hypothetical protein
MMNQIETKGNIKFAGAEKSCGKSLKIPHSVIIRAPGLLPMLYTITELAQELDILAPTIRDWLEQGMPQQRDARDHIWIDGRQFAQWVAESSQARSAEKMAEDKAYCFHCRKPVRLIDPVRKRQGKKILLQGVCPICAGTIYRGSRVGQS